MSFGHRLRELREAAGLTQQQLADAVGVGRDAIARWEAEVREPMWSNVKALAEALNVTCDAFAADSEEPSPRKPGRPRKDAADDKTAAQGKGRGRKKKGGDS